MKGPSQGIQKPLLVRSRIPEFIFMPSIKTNRDRYFFPPHLPLFFTGRAGWRAMGYLTPALRYLCLCYRGVQLLQEWPAEKVQARQEYSNKQDLLKTPQEKPIISWLVFFLFIFTSRTPVVHKSKAAAPCGCAWQLCCLSRNNHPAPVLSPA